MVNFMKSSLVAAALIGVFAPGVAAQKTAPAAATAPLTESYAKFVEADRAQVIAAHSQLSADRRIYGPWSPQARQDRINEGAAHTNQKADEKLLASARKPRKDKPQFQTTAPAMPTQQSISVRIEASPLTGNQEAAR